MRAATNVAPFSFFNLMSGDPPLICVGIGVRDGAPKDTARNIAERGEFTVNLVSSALASRMNVTAVDFPHGVDEAQEAGLLLAPGERVSVPRGAVAGVVRMPAAPVAAHRRTQPGDRRGRRHARPR